METVEVELEDEECRGVQRCHISEDAMNSEILHKKPKGSNSRKQELLVVN